MWNHVSCKSGFKEYLRQREDEKLSKCISNIKPIIDTSNPKTRLKTAKNNKGKSRVKTEREKEIMKENKMLLQRMLKIDLKKNSDKKLPENISLKSLNQNSRQKKIEEIKLSNKTNSKRIKTTGSVYSLEKWQEFNRFHEYVRDNISRNSGRVGKKKIVIDCEKKGFNGEFEDSLKDSFEEFLTNKEV